MWMLMDLLVEESRMDELFPIENINKSIDEK